MNQQDFLSALESHVAETFGHMFTVCATVDSDDNAYACDTIVLTVQIHAQPGGPAVAYRTVGVKWDDAAKPFETVDELLPGGVRLNDNRYMGAGTILMAAVEDYFIHHHACRFSRINAGSEQGGYKWLQYGYTMSSGTLAYVKELFEAELDTMQGRLAQEQLPIPLREWKALRKKLDALDPDDPENALAGLIDLSQTKIVLKNTQSSVVMQAFQKVSLNVPVGLEDLLLNFAPDHRVLRIGHAIMAQIPWSGYLDFANPDSMARRSKNVDAAWQRLATIRVAHAMHGCLIKPD